MSIDALKKLYSLSPQERGRKLEIFIKKYLKHIDPMYKGYFTEVWLWREYPDRGNRHDLGVDLVAMDEFGNKWAIQVKFHEKEISYGEISTFLAMLGMNEFNYGMIITNSPLNTNAERMVRSFSKHISIITFSQIFENIDETKFSWNEPENIFPPKRKKIRKYQQEAVEAVRRGFEESDRGKLIMPPGSGKTFVALKIAEKLLGEGKRVLFLCPSIALLDQNLRAWLADSEIQLETLAVVSDKTVGKEQGIYILSMPPTTNARDLLVGLNHIPENKMTVVFSTYQSIDVIEEAQKMGAPEFDLIICDEAHKTTGIKLESEDPTTFKKVHSDKHVKGKKRLYMTATPRIFEPNVKKKLEEMEIDYYSMDDEETFGKTFYEYTFRRAVDEGYLSDYKVIIFSMTEEEVLEKLYEYLRNPDALKLDSSVKLIGMWKVLQSEAETEYGDKLEENFKRTIIFTSTIAESKTIVREFEKIVKEYEDDLEGKKTVVLEHIDGMMNSSRRKALLDWLREDPKGEIRALVNAKVLTEGIDVPALDAVVFLRPKSSVVEIIQALGRVMRKAEGKRYGYVVIPVIIRPNKSESEQIEDTSYKTIWQIASALRAIDETFEARLRKLVIHRTPPGNGGGGYPGRSLEDDILILREPRQTYIPFNIMRSLIARIAKSLGLTKKYIENWAKEVAQIAERLHKYIEISLEKDENVKRIFDEFHMALKSFINEEIQKDQALTMIVQHILTKPIFDALFYEFDFIKDDIVIQSLDKISEIFKGYIERETKDLEKFYKSVEIRAQAIDRETERQEFIRTLYDSFFKIAFKKTAEELGIVYTPVEVVDFIIKSVEYLLKEKFQKSFSDRDVVILEPFTGTGTFLSRLFHHIPPEDLKRKYQSDEIWGNEILLLPYYIAKANVESTYYEITKDYKPFRNLLLVDTFKMMELIYEDKIYPPKLELFPQKYAELLNSERKANVNVIISNPPWFTKQTTENLGIKRPKYEKIRQRISETYVKYSKNAHLKNSLYDSYIMAIRMASDRIGEKGIIGFVTNSGWVDGNAMDGMRQILQEEFSEIYILDLRGNARTQGERRKKEGGGIFGQGSRAGVCIALFVKDSEKNGTAKIYYHDIGDYLSREEKLEKLNKFQHVGNVSWIEIMPNEFNDWINQRSISFYKYPPIGSKKKGETGIFEIYSRGIASSRDAWVYNFSRKKLEENMRRMIDEYNRHVDLVKEGKITKDNINNAINSDPSVIAWDGTLKNELLKARNYSFEKAGQTYISMYRPFVKMYVYFSKVFNNSTYQLPRIFPTPESENIVIGVSGKGSNKPFSILAISSMYDVQILQNVQAFPLYIYNLGIDGYPSKAPNISKWVIDEFKKRFKFDVNQEDIFYYIYGLLHSPDYREKFKNELRKDLPRIPLDVPKEIFEEFRNAGENLAKIHLNYENYNPYPLKIIISGDKDDPRIYMIEKMTLDKDKGILKYNNYITFEGIPKETFEYKLGGYSPLEWVVNFYKIQEKGKTRIIWDPNDWLKETGNHRYVFDLIPRLVSLSLDTIKIMKSLKGKIM